MQDTCENNGSTYWVKKNLGLSHKDELELVSNNEWLSDTHIIAAMKLLQEQYTDQNGLSNSILLSADCSWKSNGLDNFVQIINVSKQHWVCVSNINCFPHTVDVLDSIRGFSVNSTSLKSQIATILRTPTNSFNINFIDIQTQIGAKVCNFFAVAFAVALCSVRDPHLETYNQNKMRNHLHKCFSAGRLNIFPPSSSRQRRGTRIHMSIHKHCTCRQPCHGTVQGHHAVVTLCNAVSAESGTLLGVRISQNR